MGYSIPKLSDHPNFGFTNPQPGETQIEYALRSAAHLLSPPKVDGEDEEIKCDVAAAEMISLNGILQNRWDSSAK